MQIKSISSACALAIAALAAPAHAITFSTFVTGSDLAAKLGNTATIGFTYAGDKFVGSVYYGANNNQLYSTDLTGGNVQKFGAPIAGFSGEVYVTSSLGIGGFGPRDVYAGPENMGKVVRIAHDGSSQGDFVTGLSGGVRSIAFDPYGLYGNQMIVATNLGNIYTVSNAGVASLLTNVGEDAEGLSFAPQNFGPYATGTLFVASEGSGSLRAITPAGAKTVIATVASAEMVSFVPLNLGSSGNPVEGFYAAAYPSNVQRASPSEFIPYIGDAIITGETSHLVSQVHWDGSKFVVNTLGSFPAQPEDGIFVTADVINPPDLPAVPEPETWALMLAGIAGVSVVARRRSRRQS